MSRTRSTPALAAGCAVVLLVNLWLLAAAAWNRRGEPQAQLTLTERELTLVADEQEEHGGLLLSFRLTSQLPGVVQRAGWIKRHRFEPHAYRWLDREKLRELGFAVALDAGDPEAEAYYNATRQRRVYLALEFEGPAWEQWMAERERRLDELRREVEDGTKGAEALEDAEALLALDREMRSRLFPVDAGLDAEELRRRHSDRQRHVVVEGLVRPRIVTREDDTPVLTGQVQGPIPGQVNVPLSLRETLEPLRSGETRRERTARERDEARVGWPAPVPPRYRAVVAFGRGHEPWLAGVEAITSAN